MKLFNTLTAALPHTILLTWAMPLRMPHLIRLSAILSFVVVP